MTRPAIRSSPRLDGPAWSKGSPDEVHVTFLADPENMKKVSLAGRACTSLSFAKSLTNCR
jgi:hypothetical protein